MLFRSLEGVETDAHRQENVPRLEIAPDHLRHHSREEIGVFEVAEQSEVDRHVNFLVIVHGSSDFSAKIDILFSGHKKYYGQISILGMGSLSI